jgi:phosphatidylglycerophosphate synthase
LYWACQPLNWFSTSLDLIDGRFAQAERQRGLAGELFAAMLDELMTGRIRVNDLDLAELGVAADA